MSFMIFMVEMFDTVDMETRRLLLRPLQETDLDALSEILGDPDTMRYFDVCRPMTRPEVGDKLAYWMAHHKQHGFMPGLIVLKADGQAAGHGGLAYYPETEALGPELIYIFKKPCWGQGLATEFARAALAFGFNRLKVNRILATVRPENSASIAVLKKIGMAFRDDLPEMNRRLYDMERC